MRRAKGICSPIFDHFADVVSDGTMRSIKTRGTLRAN
jgi:hypothetical protein